MPTRTVFPTISITCTTTSSPTRRVMSSMVPPWIQLRANVRILGVLRGNSRVGGEELRANGGVRGLVDHLMALAVGDQDRGTQVRVEVGQLSAGTDRDPH